MLINLKSKSIYIALVCTVFFFITLKISDLTPFYGDEFYTLDIENINKPITYNIILSRFIESISVGPDSIFTLRLSSVVFSILGIILFLWYIPKDHIQFCVASFVIVSNSFIIRDAIFFRYYSFYFLCSVLLFIYIIRWSNYFSINNKLVINGIGIIVAPYLLFIMNTLQFIFAFIFLVIYKKIKNYKYRLIMGSTVLFSLLILLLFPKIIWIVFNSMNISEHMIIDINSINIRGFSIAILVKPFYAFFQMIFGYHLTPSESFFIIILFLLLAFSYCYLAYLYFKSKGLESFLLLLFTICMPFLFIYYIIEPLSFEGFTQLESKHGMLILPLILFFSVKSVELMPKTQYIPFLILLLSSQLLGLNQTFNSSYTDWEHIIQKIKSNYNKNDTALIIDGRSIQNVNFYGRQSIDEENTLRIWMGVDSLKKKVRDKSNVILLMNDYKSYSNLSLKQNWNAGGDSYSKVSNINSILHWLNNEYSLRDSYIYYPTFMYVMNKKEFPDNGHTFSVWKHHLKDLRLPIKTNYDKKILSSVLIASEDSLDIIIDSTLFMNLENSIQLSDGDTVGIMETNTKSTYLIKGVNIWDLFAEFYGEPIDEEKVFHSWLHTPLVSGSIKYDGSYFKHRASLYYIDHDFSKGATINLINTSKYSMIRVWL